MPNPIALGTADTFAVLAGTSVTNTNTITALSGSLGVSPGNVITGFPPGQILSGSGTIHNNDATATQAHADLVTAYAQAVAQVPNQNLTGIDLGTLTLVPGVYNFTSPASLNGTLILDGQGNDTATAVWIFQMSSTFAIGAGSGVRLIGTAKGKNVFWQVADAVTVGTSTQLIGTFLVQNNITAFDLVESQGGLLSVNGTVALDNDLVFSHNTITASGGDPHILCLDNSRLDVYDPGFYRLFDNCKSMDNRVLINADIQRDTAGFDYYHQLWIRIQSELNYLEYHLRFLPESQGIIVNNAPKPVMVWKQNYMTPDGIRYLFTCESQYNAVFLSTDNRSNQAIKYAGLMAGIISPITSLTDQSETPSRFIKPMFYDQNAVMTGSMGPQLISVQKRALHPHSNWYRLLQWPMPKGHGSVNLYLDYAGRARQLIIHTEEDSRAQTETWRWLGEDPTKLTVFHNGSVISHKYIREYNYDLPGQGSILLRVQGNGSISASFRRAQDQVRGLMFEDILVLTNPQDYALIKLESPLPPTRQIPESATLYQRMVDPTAS